MSTTVISTIYSLPKISMSQSSQNSSQKHQGMAKQQSKALKDWLTRKKSPVKVLCATMSGVDVSSNSSAVRTLNCSVVSPADSHSHSSPLSPLSPSPNSFNSFGSSNISPFKPTGRVLIPIGAPDKSSPTSKDTFDKTDINGIKVNSKDNSSFLVTDNDRNIFPNTSDIKQNGHVQSFNLKINRNNSLATTEEKNCEKSDDSNKKSSTSHSPKRLLIRTNNPNKDSSNQSIDKKINSDQSSSCTNRGNTSPKIVRSSNPLLLQDTLQTTLDSSTNDEEQGVSSPNLDNSPSKDDDLDSPNKVKSALCDNLYKDNYPIFVKQDNKKISNKSLEKSLHSCTSLFYDKDLLDSLNGGSRSTGTSESSDSNSEQSCSEANVNQSSKVGSKVVDNCAASTDSGMGNTIWSSPDKGQAEKDSISEDISDEEKFENVKATRSRNRSKEGLVITNCSSGNNQVLLKNGEICLSEEVVTSEKEKITKLTDSVHVNNLENGVNGLSETRLSDQLLSYKEKQSDCNGALSNGDLNHDHHHLENGYFDRRDNRIPDSESEYGDSVCSEETDNVGVSQDVNDLQYHSEDKAKDVNGDYIPGVVFNVPKNPLINGTYNFRSKLKRKATEDSEDVGPSKVAKRNIQFEGVTVFYFPRSQGFTCVPSQGGSTLGMSRLHSHIKQFSLAEHALEQRKTHREYLLRIRQQRRSHRDGGESSSRGSSSEESEENSEDASDLSDSELDADSYYFLQPLPIRQRRALLRSAGFRNIDGLEKEECKDIRVSREFCGCQCKVVCDPDTCLCAQAGIKCQVDRHNFPCGCSRDGCGNSYGRIEFNPIRVRTHFIHTLMRIEIEKRQQQQQWQNQQRAKWLASASSGVNGLNFENGGCNISLFSGGSSRECEEDSGGSVSADLHKFSSSGVHGSTSDLHKFTSEMGACVGVGSSLYPHFESRQILSTGTSPVYVQHDELGDYSGSSCTVFGGLGSSFEPVGSYGSCAPFSPSSVLPTPPTHDSYNSLSKFAHSTNFSFYGAAAAAAAAAAASAAAAAAAASAIAPASINCSYSQNNFCVPGLHNNSSVAAAFGQYHEQHISTPTLFKAAISSPGSSDVQTNLNDIPSSSPSYIEEKADADQTSQHSVKESKGNSSEKIDNDEKIDCSIKELQSRDSSVVETPSGNETMEMHSGLQIQSLNNFQVPSNNHHFLGLQENIISSIPAAIANTTLKCPSVLSFTTASLATPSLTSVMKPCIPTVISTETTTSNYSNMEGIVQDLNDTTTTSTSLTLSSTMQLTSLVSSPLTPPLSSSVTPETSPTNESYSNSQQLDSLSFEENADQVHTTQHQNETFDCKINIDQTTVSVTKSSTTEEIINDLVQKPLVETVSG
ncbi:unnamed protein product [Meganyctiphanes norvegica]|uniref:Cysteine/serine-rich nuclear protein N-terminal domain-containing protein n=1 Tax=Meganyctiphanes norvegica TaxID=48144 RepID=A0AAV2Q694_MEGNR